MNHHPLTFLKVLLIVIIVVSLIVSVILSLTSVTGYVVADHVDSDRNLAALVLLLVGVFGAILYLAKFR